MLYFRRSMMAKVAALEGGVETELYKSLARSISRMTNPPQHHLAKHVLVDVRGRMKAYKSCMCTEFYSPEELNKDARRTYTL